MPTRGSAPDGAAYRTPTAEIDPATLAEIAGIPSSAVVTALRTARPHGERIKASRTSRPLVRSTRLPTGWRSEW